MKTVNRGRETNGYLNKLIIEDHKNRMLLNALKKLLYLIEKLLCYDSKQNVLLTC